MAQLIAHCDDDEFILELVEMCMQGHDIDYRAFVSPQVLLQSLESMKPDLILLDKNFPNSSGDQIAQQIYSIDSSLLIIFMSGNATPIEAFPANVIGEITKPFDLNKIYEYIFAIFEAHLFASHSQYLPKPDVGCNEAPLLMSHNKSLNTSLEAITCLQNEYVHELQSQVEKCYDIWRQDKISLTLNSHNLLTNLVHKISGTSGLYGFNEVSNLACEIESQLRLIEAEFLSLDQIAVFDRQFHALNLQASNLS